MSERSSSNIDFFLQLMASFFIPSQILQYPVDDHVNIDRGLRDEILGVSGCALSFNNWAIDAEPATIYYITDEFLLHYTLIQISDDKKWMCCGPVLYEKMTRELFDHVFSAYGLAEDTYERLFHFYNTITVQPLHAHYERAFTILADSIFGYGNYHTAYIDANDSKVWLRSYKNFSDGYNKPFVNVQHAEKRQQLENSMLEAVSHANEDRAIELFFEYNTLHFPASFQNDLRENKNHLITLNTLLRKTAENSGVHPIHINAYSDSNIQIAESLAYPEQCLIYAEKMIRGYCTLIKTRTIRNYSLIIQKTITYINTNLDTDLSLNMLASQLSISSNYLSTLFKKEMGLPLTEYVNQSRIETAKRLLTSTSDSIKSIASQCGFEDVYYFNRMFKRLTQTTPKAFRDSR